MAYTFACRQGTKAVRGSALCNVKCSWGNYTTQLDNLKNLISVCGMVTVEKMYVINVMIANLTFRHRILQYFVV